KRLLAIKRKRLERIQPYLSQIDFSFYPRMRDLQLFLERIMGSKGKTIVFAVKMYGYGARILTGRFIPYPMEVEIPWDSRIQKLSRLLGYKKEDWQSLSQETHIPPLHLDSILWPIFTQKEKYEALGGPYKELLEVLHGLDDSLSAFGKA
ncbi:MAG: N-glycosylase/DNA lyase, partial [Candidatus Micrarchaeota archaeon]|nr:N-glycosylase/DNA lyase [Candidatus Micrarchaeota archaeon]